MSVYKSLILRNFDYFSAVWGCIGSGLTQKLQKLQNRVARIITGFSYDTRSAQILSDLDWPNLARIITGFSYDTRSAQILSDLDWPNLAHFTQKVVGKLHFLLHRKANVCKTMNNF